MKRYELYKINTFSQQVSYYLEMAVERRDQTVNIPTNIPIEDARLILKAIRIGLGELEKQTL